MGYNGYTEKKKMSNQKYAEKFVRSHLRMTRIEKIFLEKTAAAIGKSFNQFMVESALEHASNVTILMSESQAIVSKEHKEPSIRRKTSENMEEIIERPHIRMTKEEKENIEKAAALTGRSFNLFVMDSALEKAEQVKI